MRSHGNADAKVAGLTRSVVLWSRLARIPEAGMLIAVLATAIMFSLIDPRFASPRNLANIASQISFLAVLAVSMTYVIICGEIDLSIGSIVGLCGVVFGLVADT